MQHTIMKHALTYDDIQLVPNFSKINSRTEISLRTPLTTNYSMLMPLIASPMDTVCEFEMAYKMFILGGAGCIHRFMSAENQSKLIEKLSAAVYGGYGHNYIDFGWDGTVPIVAAIGVNGAEDRDRAEKLVAAGANVLVIDVAHGHHQKVIDMLKWCKDKFNSGADIIAGNIATAQAAIDLQEAGADGLRVGIGGGSLCTTRIKTGFGVPNVSCIEEISNVALVPVMADGGVRTSGDIAKALAVGANCVMLGSLLAGTDESPGQIIEKTNGLYKRYRGSASLETKVAHGQAARNVEGESTVIPYKGGTKFIVNGLLDGVRSALSYAGATNLHEYYPEYVIVTNAGINEAKPHLL